MRPLRTASITPAKSKPWRSSIGARRAQSITRTPRRPTRPPSRWCYRLLARRPASQADHEATRPTVRAHPQSQRPNASSAAAVHATLDRPAVHATEDVQNIQLSMLAHSPDRPRRAPIPTPNARTSDDRTPRPMSQCTAPSRSARPRPRRTSVNRIGCRDPTPSWRPTAVRTNAHFPN